MLLKLEALLLLWEPGHSLTVDFIFITFLKKIGFSGSGKSTLMAALAHRDIGKYNFINLSEIFLIYFPSGGMCVDGDIVINGRPIGNFMRHYSGFMHQEDIFVGSLTVLEHMNIMVKQSSEFNLQKYILFNCFSLD